ncbi:MAG: crossover junction endodeoxyribonuclease RuvC [Bacteroidetes bacterium]|nr:crossover junction endodeoxyribonuclease RuvC [Bacteroidota bacterium]MCY4224101.1 crossover junction endodeoxyribonuclease RuvC [Bacteroidota bacterium]
MVILGIDPGSSQTGYGIIDASNHVHGYGLISLTGDHMVRIQQIYQEITKIIQEYKPTTCAIEMPVYGNNPQAMLKLGRAQAAAMLSVLNQGLSVAQYTPKMVKRSVTGNGNASKEQVAYMVKSLLKFNTSEEAISHDISDALAVAVCHQQRESTGEKSETPRYSGWSAFVRDNPDRVAQK